MESRSQNIWSQMKYHDHHRRRRFHSENISQVDLTLRLGLSNANASERPDIDHNNNNPFFSTTFHNINHHSLQTHQVMVNNHGLARNSEMMMSEANYNPHQIVWSKELKTYVLKSSNFGQIHPSNSYSNTHQAAKAIATTPNNSPNLPLPKHNNDLYTLLNPASRLTDDHEAEASSGGKRKGSRRRRASASNDAERRCTNYNCNTNFTPMWRKGPLGPKSLCNACGIRYRKETMNREAMGAENSHG